MSQTRARRIVVVGIPGVGKSTVVNRVVDKLTSSKGGRVELVNYGTVMMSQASNLYSVRSRDDIRRLSVEDQRRLQLQAASEISKKTGEYVIVDTHLFIATREGYWPGMPLEVIQELKPTHLVLVTATIEEIMRRREYDTTRSRDKADRASLLKEVDAAKTLLYVSSVISGAPALMVENSEGMVDSTAQQILRAVE